MFIVEFGKNIKEYKHITYKSDFSHLLKYCEIFDNRIGGKALSLTLKTGTGTSLVAQWLRICLPMQGTRVRALAQEDPTCHKATKPVRHNY